MRKQAKIIIFVGVLIGLLIAIFMKLNEPLKINTYTVQKKTMTREFKESANTKFQNKISLSTPYNAKILYIIDEGKTVKKGDLLLQLDDGDLLTKKNELISNQNALVGQEKMGEPTIYDSQIKSLDVAISMAKDTLERAIKDKDKYKNLYEEGAVSKTEFDNYERAYEDAKQLLELKQSEKNTLLNQSKIKNGTKEFYQSQRNSIQVNIDDINSKISKQKVYSSVEGIVTKVNMKKGNFATNAIPIMEISSINNVIISCDVLASDAATLKIGQNVKILEKIGEDVKEKQGNIINIANYATTKISSLGLNEQRVEVKINSNQLQNTIIGADMDVVFETMRLINRIVLPKSAVFEDEKGKYVWVIKNNKLDIKNIKTGAQSDYDYEIISGINEEDVVVLDPNNSELKIGKKAVSTKN